MPDSLANTFALDRRGAVVTGAASGRLIREGGGGSFYSGGADNPVRELSFFFMTRASVNMPTRTVADEMEPHGIRANASASKWVETPTGTHTGKDASASRFMTGQVLRPKGGVAMP